MRKMPWLFLILSSNAFAGPSFPPPPPDEPAATAPQGPRGESIVPEGRINVINQSGGTVMVSIEGRQPLELMDGANLQTAVSPGSAHIHAFYEQFGREFDLQDNQISVSPSRPATVVLAPEPTARVMVENKTCRPATVFVNGEPMMQLMPGDAQIVEADVGPAELSLRAGQYLIGSTHLNLRAFVENRWRVEEPRGGEVTVQNPLPIPVELVTDQGELRTVPAYGRTTWLNVPFGSFHVKARRVTDEYISEARINVHPGPPSYWDVDPPQTGLVNLDNDHWLGSRVTVDGTSLATLAPHQDRRLTIPLGWHQVVVRDDRGRVLSSRWIEVKAFETGLLQVGMDYHTPAVSRYDRPAPPSYPMPAR